MLILFSKSDMNRIVKLKYKKKTGWDCDKQNFIYYFFLNKFLIMKNYFILCY